MTILWFIVWLLSNHPNVFNSTGNDSAWLVCLIVAGVVDISSWGGRS